MMFSAALVESAPCWVATILKPYCFAAPVIGGTVPTYPRSMSPAVAAWTSGVP